MTYAVRVATTIRDHRQIDDEASVQLLEVALRRAKRAGADEDTAYHMADAAYLSGLNGKPLDDADARQHPWARDAHAAGVRFARKIAADLANEEAA